MNAQQLKNSLLQQAIEGKLVEQRPEEGTARDLLREIRAEKARLIAEGKLKKEKPLPEIRDEEIPFEIPESWVWVRLGDVSNYGDTKQKIVPSEIKPEMWTLDMEDIEKESGRVVRTAYAKDRTIAGEKIKFRKGDILYSKLRPYLKKILVAPADGICTSELVPFQCYGNLDAEFITCYLRSPYVTQIVNAASYGVKMPRVNKDTMMNMLVPLPPLAEQKRIVAKIEELLPYVEQYGKAHDALTSLNGKFPEAMKKSVLQYAMEGKLVEQRPEEGTAEDLMREIRAEKSRLVAEGKLKKEKPLPPIKAEEIPFEIPKSWVWVRLGEITSALGDGIHGTPQYDENGSYYFINGNNLIDGKITIKSNTKTVSKEMALKYHLELNDTTCFVSINGTIGNTAFYNNEPVILGKSACYFNLMCAIEKKYINHVILSDYFMRYALTEATGTTIKNVSLKAMRYFLIPLPPLAEQQRIVAKIEELLACCELWGK